MFLNPFPDAFGLDFSDLSIKVVLLRNVSRRRHKRSYEPVVIRRTDLSPGLIVNGVLEEPEKVRKYLLHLLNPNEKEKAIKSSWVVASLPDTQTFLKRIDIEKNANDVIEEDILIAAKHHIPFDENEYYIDWQIFQSEKTSHTTSVLIAATPKKIADMFTYLLESVGLNVIALEIETVAIARTLITAVKDYTNEARGILDLGGARSSLTIVDHGQIQTSITIPWSGSAVTAVIADQCRLPIEKAEREKLNNGLDFNRDKNILWTVLNKKTGELTAHISQVLQFYYSHFPNPNKITHITMCGGTANMKSLDKFLSQELKISAHPGQVWKNLSLRRAPPLSDADSLSYASAIGLAMRAAANPFFPTDEL